MAEVAVSAAISFFQSIPNNSGKPYLLAFSTKSTSTDIAQDALKFSDQLVSQINQKGTDTDTQSVNIDEFTRLASGDQFKKFSDITDAAKKSIIKETFSDITKGKSVATSADIANYLTVRDGKDGKTDGSAVINFLI